MLWRYYDEFPSGIDAIPRRARGAGAGCLLDKRLHRPGRPARTFRCRRVPWWAHSRRKIVVRRIGTLSFGNVVKLRSIFSLLARLSRAIRCINDEIGSGVEKPMKRFVDLTYSVAGCLLLALVLATPFLPIRIPGSTCGPLPFSMRRAGYRRCGYCGPSMNSIRRSLSTAWTRMATAFPTMNPCGRWRRRRPRDWPSIHISLSCR